MTEVLVGQKRPFEELGEVISAKRQKVALTVDPEWQAKEAEEYEEDKDEFTPAQEEKEEEEYYEEEIKDDDVTEEKILEDLVCLKDIMPEGYEFDDSSMNAIKALAKDYLIEVFENAKLIAKKIGGRDVLTEQDMQVAVEIMQRTSARAAQNDE
mmetsp:Transcript_5863/g.9681  ORF Transcript_5863/g.9681 Transcript_5863/m.9681 type:complete len:154 (+) Transcript_5863:46-507(+)